MKMTHSCGPPAGNGAIGVDGTAAAIVDVQHVDKFVQLELVIHPDETNVGTVLGSLVS